MICHHNAIIWHSTLQWYHHRDVLMLSATYIPLLSYPWTCLQFGAREAIFASVLSLRVCFDTSRWKPGRAGFKHQNMGNLSFTHRFLNFEASAAKTWFRTSDSWPHFLAGKKLMRNWNCQEDPGAGNLDIPYELRNKYCKGWGPLGACCFPFLVPGDQFFPPLA